MCVFHAAPAVILLAMMSPLRAHHVQKEDTQALQVQIVKLVLQERLHMMTEQLNLMRANLVLPATTHPLQAMHALVALKVGDIEVSLTL